MSVVQKAMIYLNNVSPGVMFLNIYIIFIFLVFA